MRITITETTVQDVSGWSVAASNIYERQVQADDQDVVARLSAQLTIWREAEPRPRREIVVEGSVVWLGHAAWRVVRIDDHSGEGGSAWGAGSWGAVILDKAEELTDRPAQGASALPR